MQAVIDEFYTKDFAGHGVCPLDDCPSGGWGIDVGCYHVLTQLREVVQKHIPDIAPQQQPVLDLLSNLFYEDTLAHI